MESEIAQAILEVEKAINKFALIMALQAALVIVCCCCSLLLKK